MKVICIGICCEVKVRLLPFIGVPPFWALVQTGYEFIGGDMLQPREADLPVLFLVLIVLPVVTYILLGRWTEAAKKKNRISLLAQLASEEAFRVEAMTSADVIPPLVSSKTGFYVCARCFAPATTRCSKCKSIRYWYDLFSFVLCHLLAIYW